MPAKARTRIQTGILGSPDDQAELRVGEVLVAEMVRRIGLSQRMRATQT